MQANSISLLLEFAHLMSIKGIIVPAPVQRMDGITDKKLQSNPEISLISPIATTLPIDPIDLRQYVLYWDLIEVPFNSNHREIIKCEPSHEMKVLMDLGVLYEEGRMATYGVWQPPESLHLAASFVSMAIKPPEEQHKWSIGQTGRGFRFPPESRNTWHPGFELDLYQALPVFGADVPIEKVHSFKISKNNDLHRFRLAMDKMILAVATASELDIAIRELQQSIIDLNKAVDDYNKSKVMRTVSAFCSSVSFPTAVALPLSLAGFPEAGIPIGIGLAAIQLRAKDLLRILNYSPAESSAFAYLFHAQKSLGAGAAWKK